MWISDYLTKNSHKPSLSGEAEIVGGGSGRIDAVGSSVQNGARIAAPYGYCSTPPPGESAVLLSASGESYCLGVQSAQEGLASGEIRICSAGGARIELKNDGRVYINGKAVE